MHATKEPGWIPYRWWWGLGAACILLAILFAVERWSFWASIAMGFAGVTQVILGFIERHRGAPPL